MSEALIITILQFATKFGIEAGIALAEGLRGGATVETTLAALRRAKTLTAQDYVNADASARGVPAIPLPQ